MHDSKNGMYGRPLVSVAVLAEISFRSPRKIVIFMIKKISCRIKVSRKELI